MEPRTWFVTGCSRGFGRSLSEVLLERGERVVLTARDPATLEPLVSAHPDRALALALDVTDPGAAAAAVDAARERVGAIDVLVNNAGYGQMGSVEETTIEDARASMDTNYFGTLVMIKAVLPEMIARRSGQIVNIGSVAGNVGFPLLAHYCASKFAVTGMSESLGAELAPLGINVTVVDLGPFETGFAGSMEIVAPGAHYDPVALSQEAGNGLWTQIDDPVAGAKALLSALSASNPPRRLALGEQGLGTIEMHEGRRKAEREHWLEVTRLAEAGIP